MRDRTDEFSFFLKPSQYGIGVFAAHDIAKGTLLILFSGEQHYTVQELERQPETVPEIFQHYCVHRGHAITGPKNFGCMSIGWYLNHSPDYNARHDDHYQWYATRDIKAGEEILVDYNTLEEPEELKADYYRKC